MRDGQEGHGVVQGKDRKLAQPFHRPERIVSLTPTNAKVVLVDHYELPLDEGRPRKSWCTCRVKYRARIGSWLSHFTNLNGL